MIAVKLSVQQLIEALSGLSEKEKIRVREALNTDFEIADTELEELLNRKRDFQAGRVSSRPWAEIRRNYDRV
ncbi:hypothetical protein [Daejeonella sp.]|mgnify:CR=1 FL=1|uniref:hypothetical protein n=1 Tax=Daejeonella sp. TaxID=2805397 RepID=UPI002CB59C31|nr:hypothetical protein [Daejeonella sp.]HQT59544.1 hypothetical protein [Daejeonella sp.]